MDMNDKNIQKANYSHKISLFNVIKFGLILVARTMLVFFVVFNIVGVLHGVSYGFTTFVTQHFYDSIAGVINGIESIRMIYTMVVLLGLTFIVREILNGLDNFMYDKVVIKLSGEMAKCIHSKMARIDPICLEDTTYHDDIEKASAGSEAVIHIVITAVSVFSFYLSYFVFMGFYLNNLKPVFLLALVFVFMPSLCGQFIRTGIMAKFEDKVAPINREFNYYNSSIIDKEYFKETRMLGAYDFLLKRFFKSLRKLSKAEWKRTKKINLLELIIALLTTLGWLGILYMLVMALFANEISIGTFAAVFSSISMMFSMMSEMIDEEIGKIALDMGKAHNFIRFINLPERRSTNDVLDYKKGIIANKISFTYPHAKHKSVDGISVEIKEGETVAIVGENGSGKTTLARLLMGLYVPTEGKVILNGVDTSSGNGEILFNKSSGVFQKYQRYQMTLEENIRISDINNKSSLDSVLSQVGVDENAASYQDGIKTMLSREFDGVELSGGEWQRIAIARGLYRAHNIIVLDEPTAAIDPLEESRIYKKFIEISKGKTAIIITHRLASTKIAARVFVMDNGKLDDMGTHLELLNKNGLYAKMFNSQAMWYQ